MKGVLPWMVRWALLAGTRDLYSALAALGSPVKHIFHTYTISINVPIAQQLGKAVVHGHLSLNVCLREQLHAFLLSKSFSSVVPTV